MQVPQPHSSWSQVNLICRVFMPRIYGVASYRKLEEYIVRRYSVQIAVPKIREP